MNMFTECRTIKVERILSDYCKGCDQISIEAAEEEAIVDGKIHTIRREYCKYGALCERLYSRLKKDGI